MTLTSTKLKGGIAAIALTAAIALGAQAMTGPSFLSDEDRSLKGFSKIYSKGPIDAKISVGKKFSVSVDASDSIKDRIITEVDGETLIIKLKKGQYSWKDYGKAVVYVTLPDLEALTVSGSGDATVAGTIDGDSLSIKLNGSGDATIKTAKADDLKLALSGSGDLRINSGSCKNISITINGSGDVDTQSVNCKIGSFSIRGSGDIDARASEEVKANIMGSGDVTVYGEPKRISSRTYGSGDVRTKK